MGGFDSGGEAPALTGGALQGGAGGGGGVAGAGEAGLGGIDGGEAGSGNVAGCIVVAPDGDDALAALSGGAVPFANVQPAIDYADQHRSGPHDVCVTPPSDCAVNWSHYDIGAQDLTMRNGISVLGSYYATDGTQCPSLLALVLGTARGVVFGPDITSPTRIESLYVIRAPLPAATAFTLDGAHGATLRDIEVTPPDKDATTSAIGVDAFNGTEATLDDFAMSNYSLYPEQVITSPQQIGVRGMDSALTITNSRIQIFSRTEVAEPVVGIAVMLDNAAGSSLRDCSIDSSARAEMPGATPVAIGLHVSGAPGLVLDGTRVGALGLSPPPHHGVTGVELVDDPGVSWSNGYLTVAGDGIDDGLVLDNSPGFHFDGTLFSYDSMDFPRDFIRITGDATGTIIAGSLGFEAGPSAAAVVIEDCAGGDPLILASIDVTSASSGGKAIRVSGDCAPTITSKIQVGPPYPTYDASVTGIECLGASRCTIDGSEIRLKGGNASSISSPDPWLTIRANGVLCDPGSCVTIRDSQIYGLSKPGDLERTIYLGSAVTAPGSTLISGNVIDAGCVGSDGFGLYAGGRIENNVILGPHCGGSYYYTSHAKGLKVDGEAYVHSNTIDGGGATDGLYTFQCDSMGIAYVGGSASFRNNILLAPTCVQHFPFNRYASAPGPTAFEHNDLFASSGTNVLYLDGSTPISDIDAVNALPGATGNFSALPLLDSTQHLSTGSPCIDAGTVTGAPQLDLDGDTRDQSPDVGADEWTAG